jgi:hypothetical protein
MSMTEMIFGSTDWRFLLVGLFYLNIGILFSSVLNTTSREPNSSRTPFRFSWKFFAKDNWKRLAKSVAFGIIAMRFSQEFFNQALTVYLAFMIGLSIDAVILLIQKRKFN